MHLARYAQYRTPADDGLPDELHDEAIERIARYSVGISGIDLRAHGEVTRKSGSGTLVDRDGTMCIVTADHVIEDIRHRDRIALLIDWLGNLRRCVVLQFACLPCGSRPDAGPVFHDGYR